MTAKRIMLKVCHENKLKYISVTKEMALTKVLERIVKRFQLDASDKVFHLGEITGKVLTPKQYRYFLSTFPKHNRILYVTSECLIQKELHQADQGDIEDKRINKRKTVESSPPINDDDDRTAKRMRGQQMWAAPVRRQDCFIHVYPEKSCGHSKRFETFRSTRIFNMEK